MEGVEGLYKKFGVLADAKDKAGEYEEEYLSILSTISNGSDAEKRLCASFIPRFFKSFPGHQETAFNAQLDLCEEEEAVIRREAIKGLPDLCKADSKLVSRMSSILSQLLPIEGHLDQTIVKHCLVQLLKQDPQAAVTGIFHQIHEGDDKVRVASKKFLLERLADSDRYIPSLQSNDDLRASLVSQLIALSQAESYEGFKELVSVSSGIDRKKTVKVLSRLLDLESPFDPSDPERIELFSMVLPVVLKYHGKTSTTSHIISYYNGVLPVFSKIEDPKHKIMMLRGLTETIQTSLTEDDAALCIDGIYSLLLSYLPEEVQADDVIEDPFCLNFSVLECLLFALNKSASLVPTYLKEESRIDDVLPKLQFVLRCCTCFAKRLKGSSIGEDTPETVQLKTKAYKTCNNTKELVKGLTATPVTYKTEANFSWKVDLTNVTNRLFTPLVSDSKRPGPGLTEQSEAKRRKSSDQYSSRRGPQQVYAPPIGRYYKGSTNGEERRKERRY